MAVFGLGRKRTATAEPAGGAPDPRTLPCDGDAEAVAIQQLTARQDWPALRAVLAGYQGHDLASLIRWSIETPGAEWLEAALVVEKDDALAMAVLGTRTIEAAWAVRTGARAQHVSQDQFRRFHEILRVAEEQLYASVELDPQSSAAWYALLISGRGLEVGLEIQQRRFEVVTRVTPGHPGAHRQMLQQLCRKWSGSHEQMHAFATEAMRGPFGGELGDLVPHAYFEHLGDLDKDSPERAFITSAESRAELREAAERTIFRPGHHNPRAPYTAANRFAWAFSAAGLWPEAKAAFAATDGVLVNWAHFNDPAAVYRRQQALARRNA